MKRNYFLLLTLFSFGFNISKAQYTDIHDFNGAKGATPEGSLVMAGNKLYGMTDLGGANNLGCVFSMDTTGANYKDILDFSGANGKYPYYGTLAYSKGLLYGMTYQGGLNNDGCIFSIDTNGTGYKDMHNFNGAAGKNPEGSLTLLGKSLFGMATNGGASTNGCIFSIDTNGAGYKDIFDFGGTNGANPIGDLTPSLSGKVLYGATSLGGANGDGCIFSVDTNGVSYKDVFDFNDQSYPQGANPPGRLVLSGSRLLGMATNGGLLDFGVIYSVDTNGTKYKDVYEFNTTNGELPQGSLNLVGTTLYGMATVGGTNNYGCIFSLDSTGSAYKALYNFTNASGAEPFGSLTLSGKMAYGTTTQKGANSDGTIFSFNYVAAGINELTAESGAIKLFPNPSNGQFAIQSSGSNGKAVIEVYNVMGDAVFTETTSQSNTLVNMNNQPSGVYLYRVINADGSLVGEGKLVIQK